MKVITVFMEAWNLRNRQIADLRRAVNLKDREIADLKNKINFLCGTATIRDQEGFENDHVTVILRVSCFVARKFPYDSGEMIKLVATQLWESVKDKLHLL